MNNKSENELLLGMVFYSLFTSNNGRFACSLASEMNFDSDEFESLVKSGCYSFLAFSQTKFEFQDFMMTPHQFDHLRAKNPQLHELLKDARKKAQSKWSNELKSKFSPQIAAASCLSPPSKWDLTLARIEATVSCARFLNQTGQLEKSQQVLKVFAPEVIDP
jgi:hypothetical protein